MRKSKRSWTRLILIVLGLVLMTGVAHTAIPPTAPQCFEVDNGSGTVTLPPANCKYMNANDIHKVIAGLPAGTEIILAPIHSDFICRRGGPCGAPGGTLGGEKEVFSSTAVFQATGTGALAGFNRLITIPLNVETHTGPRTPGDPVQSFATDMYRLEGGITGDPDFASLTIIGGTANGHPSPGRTTLTEQSNGTYLVESSFDITFVIDYVGAGGRLGTYRGRSVEKVTMRAYR